MVCIMLLRQRPGLFTICKTRVVKFVSTTLRSNGIKGRTRLMCIICRICEGAWEGLAPDRSAWVAIETSQRIAQRSGDEKSLESAKDPLGHAA